jgi:hypothetical protein
VNSKMWKEAMLVYLNVQFPGETEESCEKPQSGYLVSWRSLEPGTSRIGSKIGKCSFFVALFHWEFKL